MFDYKTREPLTKEFILSRITEEDIFLKYMNVYPSTEGYFVNPFRNDAHPDCKFYKDSRGVLKFKDFAYKLNLDCFNVVQLANPDVNNYNDALQRIAKDFRLYEKEIDFTVKNNWEKSIKEAAKKFSTIQVKRKEFTTQELKWWQEQGIYKDTLNLYKVSSLQMLWLNENCIYNYDKKDPGYVYHFGDYNYKAYFPLRKDYRFIQNIDRTTLQGFDQLPEEGEFLVITKSMKDVMCLNSFDIPSVAPTSETVIIDEEIFSKLADRFFYIFTLFDPDRVGLWLSQQMRKKYSTIPLIFDKRYMFVQKDEPKDFTDHYKKHGIQYMQDLIEEVKQQYL